MTIWQTGNRRAAGSPMRRLNVPLTGLILPLVLVACAQSSGYGRIVGATAPEISGGEAVAVLSLTDGDRSIASCVAGELEDLNPAVRVLSREELGAAWNPAKGDDQDAPSIPALPAYFARPEIEKQIEELRLRYVLMVGGTTLHDTRAGVAVLQGQPMGMIIPWLGVKKSSSVDAKLWDTRELRQVANFSASASGTALYFPIPIPKATEGAACEEIAESVSDIFAGDESTAVTDLKQLKARAEKGYADSQYKIAVRHAEGGDIERAWSWMCRAAAQSYPEAQEKIAQLYRAGEWGVRRDLVKAYIWLSLAESSSVLANNTFFQTSIAREKQAIGKQMTPVPIAQVERLLDAGQADSPECPGPRVERVDMTG